MIASTYFLYREPSAQFQATHFILTCSRLLVPPSEAKVSDA